MICFEIISTHICISQDMHSELGLVLSPIGTYIFPNKHGVVGFSSNLVVGIFSLSIENRTAFYSHKGDDDLTLTYLGIGLFQFIQLQGENKSVRLRSDITVFGDHSPWFSDLYNRWFIFRKGIILTMIVDKSWRPLRSGWNISVGAGIHL